MVESAVREVEDSGARNWDFTQCFGDKNDIDNVTEGDVISAVEFDHSGEYFATGDCGGRVVLFKREEDQNSEYKFYTEFQSHDREFDYLKSLEIEEKINQIRWCRPQNNARYLLSTNDKTIKLWKVFEKSIKVVAENNGTDRLNSRNFANVPISQLRLPRMNLHDTIVATTPRRTYANAHAYHINSISVNSDNETFLSSDDLRINLWNLDVPNQSFNIVDIRPASMEELTEVITAMECHPTQCNEFIYSTCKGNVRMADMRERALCDNYAKIYEDPGDPMEDSFFTEITSSISDIKYARNGRYIIARDFMTVKIWDVAMERQPVKTIQVHENIRHMLCASYETESIFDKFEVEVSGDSQSIMTGSYSNNFFIYPHAIDGTTTTGGGSGALSDAVPAVLPASALHADRTEASAEDDDDDAMEDDDESRPSAAAAAAAAASHEPARSSRARDRRTRRSRRSAAPSFSMDGRRPDDVAAVDSDMMDEDEDSGEGSEQEVISLTADKNVFRKRSNAHDEHGRGAGGRASRLRMSRRNSTKVDFRKSILHLSWHPYENTVAIAATNNLFVFNAPHI